MNLLLLPCSGYAAPAVLAGAPRAVMLADAGAPAVRAPAPVAVMLADAGASAVLHLLLSRLSSDFCVPSEERSLAASASFLPARPPPPPARPHHRPAAPPCCHQPVPRQEERGSRLHDSFLKLLANAIRRCAYCVQRQRDQRDPLVYAQRNALVFRSLLVHARLRPSLGDDDVLYLFLLFSTPSNISSPCMSR